MHGKESIEQFLAHLRDGLQPSADLQQEAAKLTYNVEQPHLVAMLQLLSPYAHASEQTMQRVLADIQEQVHPALACRQGYLVTMLLSDQEPSSKPMQQLQKIIQAIPEVRIGVGQVCRRISDYRQGFAEATEALATGKYLPGEPRLVQFHELGIYRYLVAFARQELVPDRYQDIIAQLANLDAQRQGREFLHTLEVFMELGGDAKDTSEKLQIHRNTLTQRLTSIQEATGIDLEQMDLWLPLQFALKIHHIRRKLERF
jgi:sugar diacid utilization regulator